MAEQNDGIEENLKKINTEVEQSKNVLRNLVNETKVLGELVNPVLAEEVSTLRQTRMVMVSELNQCLSTLREVRTFFLDKNHSVEVERLERFVSICRELKALKSDGTLDAVADVAIRLALREQAHNEH